MRVVKIAELRTEPMGEATPVAGWTGGAVSRSRQTIIPDGDSENYRCSVVNFGQGATTGWHARASLPPALPSIEWSQPYGGGTDMPVFKRDDIELYYEEHGQGFPILLIAPGGMRSAVPFWERTPWNPIQHLAPHYRVIAMDQRNAGRSGWARHRT